MMLIKTTKRVQTSNLPQLERKDEGFVHTQPYNWVLTL